MNETIDKGNIIRCGGSNDFFEIIVQSHDNMYVSSKKYFELDRTKFYQWCLSNRIDGLQNK